MKRRDFLKKLGIACGAVVACPGKLLKGKTEREILLKKFRTAALNTKDKNGKFIIGERSKHLYFMGQRLYYNEILGEYEGVYEFETPHASTTIR